MDSTPASLLARLRLAHADDAWDRFVRLYTPLVYHVGRRAGLQSDDALDLVQEVFLLLSSKMKDFEYDDGLSFRGWLQSVTKHKLYELSRRKRIVCSPLPAAILQQQPSLHSDQDWLEEAEYQQMLAQRALELMRSEFAPTTWQACWEHVVSGRTATEVARDLGISEGAVYVAKCRVLKRLRSELAGLLD